jgi:hypothetical protein
LIFDTTSCPRLKLKRRPCFQRPRRLFPAPVGHNLLVFRRQFGFVNVGGLLFKFQPTAVKISARRGLAEAKINFGSLIIEHFPFNL